MSINKKLLILALVCVVTAAAIYVYAFFKEKPEPPVTLTTSTSTPMGKVAASQVADGTYSVQIRSIMTTPEDATITFSHVTYFEGTEAIASATHDIPCMNKPVASCVPTLTRGYYARNSGAADFTAPVTTNTSISLRDKPHASVTDLRNIKRDLEPVFDIVVKDGNIVSVMERSPLLASKG